MGASSTKVAETNPEIPVTPVAEKKLKPCCACPETRKIRDGCIIEKGEAECSAEMEAHKTCMRNLGFNI